MAIVGEAEILVVANTAAFETDLAASVDAAGLSSVGASAGADLRSGVTSETDKLGTDLAEGGVLAGASLKGGVSEGAEDIGKDVTSAVKTETTKMQGLFQDVGTKAKSTLSSFGVPAALLSGPKVAALAIAAVGAVSIKLAADMQKADASIAASAGESVKSATAIGDAFLGTAGKSEYSGIKQAQAFAQVAGELKTTEGQALSTADATTFMATATDLATASGEDLGATTSTLAGVMQAFQVSVKDSGSAANVLFNASRSTGVGLDTLASSVERVKGRLGELSPPLSDLSALMVDLTKNGITGRGALTALQGSYTALSGAAVGTSKANLLAKQTLADYGIQVVNAQGQLTPMSAIIQKLAPEFATMTQQQQLATATNIFGASAAKQMTAVIDAGVDSYNRSTDAVTRNNAVTKAAAEQQQTLSGEVNTLKAAVSDEAAKLGSVLVPALTAVAGAILPVVKGFVDVVSWFEKGGVEAKAVAITIGVILAPALINMAAQATASAAKAVIGFVTMSTSARTSATSIESSEATAATSVEGFGATVETTSAGIVTANEAAATSFLSLSSAVTVAGAGIASFLVTSQLLKTGPGKAVGDFLTKGGELNPINDIAGLFATSVKATSDKYTKKDLYDIAHPKSGIDQRGFAPAASAKDAYVAPPSTVASKAMSTLSTEVTSALSLPIGQAVRELHALGVPAKEASQVLKDAALPFSDAVKALEKAGFSAADAVKIAEDDEKKQASAAKTAATAAKSASSKATSAATKAQSTLTSEILSAITLPAQQGLEQLKALGVPANKATQVLKDAVEPFTDAVKALEKAGFDASDAVKIADAGQKVVAAQAKAAAAAATKAATAASTTPLSGVMVNGIQVSGAVYDAAIGSAYQAQTGKSLGTGQPTTSPLAALANSGPQQQPTINIAAGAVVINPAPGNTKESLLVTSAMVDQALKVLATELQSGFSQLSVAI